MGFLSKSVLVLIVGIVIQYFYFNSTDSDVTSVGQSREKRSPLPLPLVTLGSGGNCTDFGLAQQFNVVIFGDYSASSDVQGKIAVGGNAYFANGFSAGDLLPLSGQTCQQYTTIVGGQVFWQKGRNYFGNIMAGIDSTATVNPLVLMQNVGGVFSQCILSTNSSYLDFVQLKQSLLSASLNISGNAATSTGVSELYGTLTVVLSGKHVEYVTIDGSMLVSRVRYIKIQNYLPGSIVIFNVYGSESGFSNIDMEELVNVKAVFNFYQATKLTIQNVAVRGWLLAPLASATNATGVVWGSVFMQSLAGPLQINLTPLPSCQPHQLPSTNITTPICLPFGFEQLFNVFVHGDYQASSDVQGRIAVGGNAVFSDGFSAGDLLQGVTVCKEITTIIGGTLNWQSGRNYFGSITAAPGSLVNPVVLLQSISGVSSQCSLVFNSTFLNFAPFYQNLLSLSYNLTQYTSTFADLTESYTTVTVTLKGAAIEIINIPDGAHILADIRSIVVSNYKPGSILVFNIGGTAAGFKNIDLESMKDMNVIFNFYQATTLTIQGVAVRGWILAPKASSTNASGVVWGNVYIKSLTGPLQINLKPIPLCIGDSVFNGILSYASGLNTVPGKTSDAAILSSVSGISVFLALVAASFLMKYF